MPQTHRAEMHRPQVPQNLLPSMRPRTVAPTSLPRTPARRRSAPRLSPMAPLDPHAPAAQLQTPRLERSARPRRQRHTTLHILLLRALRDGSRPHRQIGDRSSQRDTQHPLGTPSLMVPTPTPRAGHMPHMCRGPRSTTRDPLPPHAATRHTIRASAHEGMGGPPTTPPMPSPHLRNAHHRPPPGTTPTTNRPPLRPQIHVPQLHMRRYANLHQMRGGHVQPVRTVLLGRCGLPHPNRKPPRRTGTQRHPPRAHPADGNHPRRSTHGTQHKPPRLHPHRPPPTRPTQPKVRVRRRPRRNPQGQPRRQGGSRGGVLGRGGRGG